MDFASFFNAVKPPYEIEQSLRFDGSSALEWVPTSSYDFSIGTWTWSVWIKRGVLGGAGDGGRTILSVLQNATQYHKAYFYGNDGSDDDYLKTAPGNQLSNGRYRDPSAWYHLVVRKTGSSSSDVVKWYINGVEVKSGSESYTGNPARVLIGASRNDTSNIRFFNGYMAEFNYVDGSSLAPTDFGEENSQGVWIPKKYGGSYGTNGFYLKFDPDATNGIGHDHSGNGNNFTPSGFVTSGTATDVMSDTPTNNFCTMNPLDDGTGDTENGNLEHSRGTGDGNSITYGTIGVNSGKWYWEGELYARGGSGSYDIGIGFARQFASPEGSNTDVRIYSSKDGDKVGGGSYQSYGDNYGVKDIIGVKADFDAGNLEFFKNGVSQGTAFTSIPTTGRPWFPASWKNDSNISHSFRWNFGQREFANPLGTLGATDYFNTVTWDGDNAANNSITVGFQPDLVWIKRRNSSAWHAISDSVRGAGKILSSNSPNGQYDNTGSNDAFKSFDSNGFTVGYTTSWNTNHTGDDYVAWCWKAGGTASDNTDGNVTSSVSANQDAGFSVVKYTSSTSTKPLNVGHGLGKKPDFILTKNLDTTASWGGYHSAIGATKSISINGSGAAYASSDYWNNTEPTDSVFTVFDSNNTHSYGTTNEFIAYCWTEKTGVSKFGSYTGDGSSTEGPVISCGFRPAMVMIKWYESVNSSESWHIYDNKRAGNPTNTVLQPDSTTQEESPSDRHIQFTEDGFQLKANGQQINRSGAKYIFAAFAGTFTADDTYKSLNTANLPTPTVKDGAKYFDSALWTNTTDVSSLSFQPDLVWVKGRYTSDPCLTDVVRGVDAILVSSDVGNEATRGTSWRSSYGQISSFDNDGFTISTGSDAANSAFNRTNNNQVAWNWKAGGSVSADNNTDGTITSTVSASPTSGFSIVGWDGTGSNGTVGHGLGVAPSVVIVKNRDDNTKGWPFQFTPLGNNYLEINNGSNTFTGSTYFQNTAPTSTVFSVGSIGSTNAQDDKMIAYCFAEVDGFFKVGTYSGTGSDKFIYCGFKPALIVIKSSSTGSRRWEVFDSTINTKNPANERISWSETSIATDYTTPDILSNGFNLKGAGGYTNDSGENYIWMAWAENPFGGDGVAPATAR